MTRRLTAAATCAAFVLALLPVGALARSTHARPSAAPAGPRTGGLAIVCMVDGADYVIDEGTPTAMRGTTPLQAPLELQPGTHTIRVSREGYLPYSDVFDIAAGETTEVEIDLVLYSGTLKVLATPGGVAVNVDGKDLGAAPVEAKVSIGEHVVRLTRPGYVEEVRRAAVKTAQTTEVTVRMVPLAEAERAAQKTTFYKKWWFWTVVGFVVAGAVSAGVAVPLTRKGSHPAEPDSQVQLP